VTGQSKIVLLAVLLLVLAYIGYRTLHPDDVVSSVSAANEKFVPLPVENPSLRTDLLDGLKKLEYQGPRRNIFTAAPPPPPRAAAPVVVAPAAPAAPPAPPPLVVPAMYFGYVTDAQTGTKRAFFSAGDDVYVLGVGEILMGRFRLLQIGNTTADLEEVSSGRRTTVMMDETGRS
jgi:hypothetical protein